MKKPSDWTILIIGIILFVVSYQFDAQINIFFNSAKFPIFDAVFSSITNFGIVFIVMLAIPSIILHNKNRKLVYLLWLAFSISLILALAIKFLFLRQRPIEPFAFPFTTIVNYSFPSMHAMVAFALLPILIKNLPKQKSFWLSFAFLAVFSRIYFGFHFLSDVVFGALAGYFTGSLLLKLYEGKKLWK